MKCGIGFSQKLLIAKKQQCDSIKILAMSDPSWKVARLLAEVMF